MRITFIGHGNVGSALADHLQKVGHSVTLGIRDTGSEKLKKALKADIDESAWSTLYSTKSRPFPMPSKGKIAIKVINHYGDEVLKVYEVK